MSKLIFTTTLAVLGLCVLATNVEAGGRRQCGVTYVAPPVAAAVTTAPAQVATVPQVQGYRAMSYQPAPEFVAPVYRGTANRGYIQDKWKLQKTDPRKYR